MVHCKEVTDADRSSRIAGSARLTMVTSMLTTNRLEQQITSTSRRCLRSSSGTGPLRDGCDGGVATVALRWWRCDGGGCDDTTIGTVQPLRPACQRMRGRSPPSWLWVHPGTRHWVSPGLTVTPSGSANC